MKLLILGAGGIGGYYGGRLVEAGADVTFLVRPVRKAQLESDGLRIVSPQGNATLRVAARLQSEVGSDYDLVLLTCKSYDLGGALETLAPAMAGSARLVPLLNGVSHLSLLNDRYGRPRVLGGTARIAATLTPEGVVQHLNDWALVAFGEQDGRMSGSVAELKAFFDKTSVSATASTDILRDLWLKLVYLHTIACMTSLLRANVGEIVRTPDGRDLCRQVFETNVEISRREGFAPDEEFITRNAATFTVEDSAYESSLMRDIERGGPTEAESILGFMLERCRAHGLPGAVHQLGYTAARAYENRRSAGRLPR